MQYSSQTAPKPVPRGLAQNKLYEDGATAGTHVGILAPRKAGVMHMRCSAVGEYLYDGAQLN